MTPDTCSWCGGPGPLATLTVRAVTWPSAYCARCVTTLAETGAYPRRTPAQRQRACENAHRRKAARL